MKFSYALSLGLAPVALAKAVHNVYPVRRDPGKLASRNRGSSSVNGAAALAAADAALLAQAGIALGSQRDIVVIWLNGGGGQATTTVNQVQTVTQTVSVGATQAAATTAAAAAGGNANAETTTAATATAAAGAAGATHTVTVGGAKGLIFEPSEVKAAVGDMVIFTFMSQNHTATQSAFATPCEPLEGGMDSGFQANPNNTVNPPPQVAMQVMVDTPLWFFCKQNGHCGKGMTFSINPTADKTQAMFQQLAISQNGTGTDSAITGGTAANTTTGGAVSSAVAGAASSVTATIGTGSTGTVSGSTGSVTGIGSVNADGSCACVVQCAAGSFPAVQAQGLGAFGGMAGSL